MFNPNLRELCAELLFALDEASEALDRTSDCCYVSFPEVYAQCSDLIGKHDKLLETARAALNGPVLDETNDLAIGRRGLNNTEVLRDAISWLGWRPEGKPSLPGSDIISNSDEIRRWNAIARALATLAGPLSCYGKVYDACPDHEEGTSRVLSIAKEIDKCFGAVEKIRLVMSTEEQQRYSARIAKIDARNKVAQQNYTKTIEDFKKSMPPTKYRTKTP